MQRLHLDSPFDIEDPEEKEGGENDLYEKFTDTPEGYLKGRAVVTNIGIFPYLVDGRVVNRLRLPEDVMSEESLKTLKMSILTDEHPKEAVNKENIKNYQVGHLGTDVRTDGYRVSCDIIITDAKTIEKVKAGKVALSCGYFSDIENVSGRKWGQSYDSKQTNIRYNHVAIVDSGRAGDDAVMRLDSSENQFICGLRVANQTKRPQEENNGIANTDSKEETMIKIIVDNKEIEVQKDAANEILAIVKDRDTFSADAAALSVKVTSLEAQVDALKEEKVKVEAEKVQLADSIEGLVAEGINTKIAVLEVAKQLAVECDAKDSIVELKKKIVLSQSDNKEVLSATMEAKGSVYVDARFDHIAENIADKALANEQIGKAVLDAEGKVKQEKNEAKVLSADEAKKAYVDSILNKKEVK